MENAKFLQTYAFNFILFDMLEPNTIFSTAKVIRWAPQKEKMTNSCLPRGFWSLQHVLFVRRYMQKKTVYRMYAVLHQVTFLRSSSHNFFIGWAVSKSPMWVVCQHLSISKLIEVFCWILSCFNRRHVIKLWKILARRVCENFLDQLEFLAPIISFEDCLAYFNHSSFEHTINIIGFFSVSTDDMERSYRRQ